MPLVGQCQLNEKTKIQFFYITALKKCFFNRKSLVAGKKIITRKENKINLAYMGFLWYNIEKFIFKELVIYGTVTPK